MIEAQDAGLVCLDGRGGHRVQILPALLTSYDRGLAAGMLSHDMVHALATRRCAQGGDQSLPLTRLAIEPDAAFRIRSRSNSAAR